MLKTWTRQDRPIVQMSFLDMIHHFDTNRTRSKLVWVVILMVHTILLNGLGLGRTKFRMSLYQKPDLMPSMVTPTLMHVLQYICKTSNLLQCVLVLLWWWCFMFLLGLLCYKESVHMKMWYSLLQFYLFSAIVYKDSRVPHGVVLFHPFFLEILSHKELIHWFIIFSHGGER